MAAIIKEAMQVKNSSQVLVSGGISHTEKISALCRILSGLLYAASIM